MHKVPRCGQFSGMGHICVGSLGIKCGFNYACVGRISCFDTCLPVVKTPIFNPNLEVASYGEYSTFVLLGHVDSIL